MTPDSKNDGQHKQILIRGMATGVGFVGVFGFAIDASRWPALVGLMLSALVLVFISRSKK